MASLRNLVRRRSSQELWGSVRFSLINDVDITQNEIGRGSFGVVYGAVYEGRRCVAKEIHSYLIEGIGDKAILQSFIKEINILSTLRHSNIVHFFGVHFREGSHVPVLIMEQMWTSLAKLLRERSSIPLVVKVHILYDVACGLKFLHSQDPPVIHRNLTANNILLNENMDAKLTDITILESIMKHRITALEAHMSPEVLQQTPIYTSKWDIFWFGCVALHTATQQFPLPTDQFEMNKDGFIKVSEYRRRWKYIEKIKDQYPNLTCLISSCIKDEPEYRPNADQVCKWFEDYQNKPEIKQHCPDSVIDCFQQDKISLVVSLDQQSTRNKALESTVTSYQSQVQDLTDSAVLKEEHISALQRQNNELQRNMQSLQLKCEQLKSQTEKLQQDLSQHTNNDITMSLSQQLQEENEALKIRINNSEQDSTRTRTQDVRKEQDRNTELKALQQKEEELSRVVDNKKENVHEKEGQERDVQSYCKNLLEKDEIQELKTKVRELERKKNENASNEKQVEHSDLTNMQNEMEEPELKLKHEEEMHTKSIKELEQKMEILAKESEVKLKTQEEMLIKGTLEKEKLIKEAARWRANFEKLKLTLEHEKEMHTKSKEELEQKMEILSKESEVKLKSQEETLKKEISENERFKKEAAYWKAKAEQNESPTDKDFEAAKLLAGRKKIEQENELLKQSWAAHQINTKEQIQAADVSCMQQGIHYLETPKNQGMLYSSI